VDQFYFESGYLVEGYYTIIREADAAVTVAVSVSAQGDIVDVTGYYFPDYIELGYFESAGQVREADAAFTVTVTQSVVFERITEAAATVSATVTKTCGVIRIRDSAAAFTAAFAPTLTATAFKNHTAVLDSVSTMSVDAVANRSANVLLDYIADLNAMAAKTVNVVSTATTTVTQSTTAVKTASPSISLSSSAAITCILGEVHSAQSQLTANSSLSTSRYFGKNRPRNIVETGDNNYINYFNTAYNLAGGTHGIYSGADSPVIFGGPLSDIVPTANESWVLSFSYVCDGTTTARSFFYSFTDSTGSERFLRLATTNTTGSQFQLNLFKTGQSTVTQTFTVTQFTTTRIAISYHNGYVAVFKDGVRTALIDLTAQTSTTWTGHNQLTKTRWSIGANTAIDEFHFSRGTFLEYNPQSTSVTATALQTNAAATTEVLWHLDNNGLDDISVTESGAAALASVFTQQTIGSGTFVPRSTSADLVTTINFTAQGDRPASASADLVTVSTLTVIIGSIKDSITLNAGAFTVTAQESRLRDAASSITSAFAPTLTATVTRGGEIALTTVFAMSTNATSFTDSDANISAVFSVTAAVDGITRPGAAAVSSEFNQTTTIGRLQSVTVPITSAFTTVMNVAYFEGTSLIAPMAAVMSVTAVKTARITKTIAVVAAINTNAIRAPRDSEYPIEDRALIHFDSQPAVDVFGGVVTNGTYTTVSGNFSNAAGRPVTTPASITKSNGIFDDLFLQPAWTVDFWFKPRELTFNNVYPAIGLLSLTDGAVPTAPDNNYLIGWEQISLPTTGLPKTANGRIFIGPWAGQDHASLPTTFTYPDVGDDATAFKHVAITWENLQDLGSSYSVRTRIFIDGILQSTLISNRTVAFASIKLKILPTIFRITDRDGNGSFTRTSQAAIDELRFMPGVQYTANFTPPVAAYDPDIFYRAGAAVLDSRTQFAVSVLLIVFVQMTVQVQTVITADVRRIRQGSLSLASAFSSAINAGKNVEIGSDLAAQSTISVDAVKVSRTGADLTVVTAQSTLNDRLRNTEVTAVTTVTASITAVKTTGIVLNLDTTATQTVTAFRIQQGESSISALYSQLTVAFQNATGTVLLESAFEMQTIAEKNAVGVIAMAAEFTQSTDTADAKTVRVSSEMSAATDLTAEGLRIQPAGADFTAQFTQTANTAQSKITRVSADFTVTATQITDIDRFRDGIALQASLGTLSCDIDRLRQFNSDLSAVFYDFTASPTFIIRVTAEFTAFNTQLTVGEIINIDPFLQLKIVSETRTLKIAQETRVLTVESETRVNIIKD
jgi:hypothetical protein